jgi:hypothetical protein
MLYRIEQGWTYVDNIILTSDTRLSADMYAAINPCLPNGITLMDTGQTASVGGPITVEETSVAEFLQKCVASCGITAWQSADGALRIRQPDKFVTDYVISANTEYSHPEIKLSKPLRRVDVTHHYQYHSATKSTSFEVGNEGDIITVDCPFLWKSDYWIEDLAYKYIAWWIRREFVSGDFRADPRLELFDVVQVETKYGTISPVMITYIKYTYNGAFHGVYEGKVIM